MTCMMILYLTVFYADDITTDSHVFRLHDIAYARSLQRTATFINFVQVIAEDSCISHFAARVKTVGDSYKSASTSILGKHIHIWRLCILQKRFASQPFNSMVSHAVT